jgi:hypothetical protein
MGNPLGEIFSQESVDTGAGAVQNDGQAQGTGYNPNFQPLLNDIPQDLHQKIIPHLQQWDKNFNDRVGKLQSDYEPWKPVLNSGATPDMVQTGLNILNLLERDPKALYDALVENYKFEQEQQQAGPVTGQGQQQQQEDPYDLRFKQMEQNFTTVAQHVLDIRRQEQEAQADAIVAQEFSQAHKKLGDFDDNWVRAHCIADPNLSVEQAASNYQQWYNAEMAKHGARPLITGSSGSGGVPGSQVDVTKLSGQQTRGLVADMIRQARAANQ